MADLYEQILGGKGVKVHKEQSDGTYAEIVEVEGGNSQPVGVTGTVALDQTTPGTTNGVTAANPLVAVPATIANGESLSAEIDLGAGRVLCGIDMPADWTAANLTFQASYNSGGTFDNLYNQYGTEKTVIAAEDRYIPLDDPAFWMGVRHLKVRSGTAASAVTQTREGGTVIQLIVKPV